MSKGAPYSAVNKPPKHMLVCSTPGRTKQSEKASCDVNRIMARYVKTGIIPIDQRPSFFADVSEMGDYRTALTNINMVQSYFMTIPPAIRQQFDNDPAVFLDFCADPANHEELINLGLLPKKPEPGQVPEEDNPTDEQPVVAED